MTLDDVLFLIWLGVLVFLLGVWVGLDLARRRMRP